MASTMIPRALTLLLGVAGTLLLLLKLLGAIDATTVVTGLFGIGLGLAGCSWWLRHVAAEGLRRPAVASRQPNSGPCERSSDMSDHESDLIGQYAVVLEKRREPIGRESALPAPRAQIHAALLKAQRSPVYRLGGSAVDVGLKVLDTFVPDVEYEDTQILVARVWAAAKSGDAVSYGRLLSQAPERQRRAVVTALDVAMGEIERSQRHERPPQEAQGR